MKRKYRQSNKRKERKSYISTLAILLFLAFIISTIFVTIQTASLGATIAEMERQEIVLQKENREMESELVKNQSLVQLDEKAGQLGYVKPKSVIYLSRDSFVAQLP